MSVPRPEMQAYTRTLMISVCITALKQLPAMWITVQNYSLQMQIKKIIIAQKNTFTPCTAWKRLVHTRWYGIERDHVQWGNLMARAPLWYHSCIRILPGRSALPTVAWIQQFGWVLYTTCLWASDSLTPWSLQLSQQEHSCLYFYLAVFFFLGVNLKMKLALRSRG